MPAMSSAAAWTGPAARAEGRWRTRWGVRSRYAKTASTPTFPSPRDFLDAGYHLVDRLLHRPPVGDDAVHRLRPHVLVVEDGELVVPGELEGHRPGRKLVVHHLAVRVLGPVLARGGRLRRRLPAPESALDVRRQVLVAHQEGDELLAALLVARALEDHSHLDRGAVLHRLAVGLVREAGRGDQLVVVLLRLLALLRLELIVVRVVEPLRGDRDGRVVRHHDRLVVEVDVVVRVLPVDGGGRRAALADGLGVVAQRSDQHFLHFG